MKTIVEVAQNLIKPFINSEDKKYAANIAPVETSPATAAHTAGTQLIYNGVLYNVTANIAADDPLATTGAGANIAVADKVTEQISSQKQALSDEVVTRAKLGAHNLFATDFDSQTDSTNGVILTKNSDGTVSVSAVNGSASINTSAVYYQIGNFTLPIGNYVISGVPQSVYTATGGKVYLQLFDVDTATVVASIFNPSSNGAFTVASATKKYRIRIRVSATAPMTSAQILEPMIRLATDADTTYRPYVPTNDELVSYRDNGIVGSKNLLPDSKSCTKFESSATGTTLVENSDGSITVANTDSSNHNLRRYFEHKLQAGKYILSIGANAAVTWNIYLSLSGTTTTTGLKQVGSLVAGTSETELTLTKEDLTTYPYMIINQNIGAGQSSTTYYPMLRIATDTDPTYQPYTKTNRELTEVAQQVEGSYILQTTDSVKVTTDGVKTARELYYDLLAAYNSEIASNPDNYYRIRAFRPGASVMVVATGANQYALTHNQVVNSLYFSRLFIGSALDGIVYDQATLSTTLSNNINVHTSSAGNWAITDRSEDVPASGTIYYLIFDVYKKKS